MAPRLTFCVPTYEGAAFLPRTLASLLAVRGDAEGGASAIEIVVGDDASTDGSADLAREIAAKDAESHPGGGSARIAVHAFRDNLGLAGNWNRTLRLARGEFVCLFGQDDLARPDFAERLVGLLARHPECGMAFGAREFHVADEESRQVVGDFFERRYPEMMRPFNERLARLAQSPSSDEVIAPEVLIDEALRFQFEINLIGEPSFVVMRRGHPALAAGFDEQMQQMVDWELWTRFFAAGPIARTPEIVGTYHVHARGSSMKNARLSRHYREFDHLLGVTLARFAGRLTGEQVGALEARRTEVQRLAIEHAAKEKA